MSDIKLFFFGTPYIEIDGELKQIKRHRSTSLALIAYLAVTEKPHTREYLETLLWPEQKPGSSNLRVLLSRLRKNLPEVTGIWQQDTSLHLIGQGQFWCDVIRFKTLMKHCQECHHVSRDYCQFCLSRWQEMIQLYQGEFLLGVDMSQSPEFDAWQRLQQDQFSQNISTVYSNIVSYYVAQAQYDLALTEAQYWVEHDRFSEQANYQIVLLLLRQGKQAAAFHHYETFANQYRAEFSAEPETPFNDLQAEVQDDLVVDISTPRSANVMSSSRIHVYSTASQMKHRDHFYGRKSVKQHIHQSLNQSHRCLIHGLAGIGKSTLARVIAIERSQAEQHEVIWIDFEEFSASDLLDELARVFDQQGIVGQPLREKQDFIHRFLLHRKFTMVLDDVWNEDALYDFLKAIPDVNAVLITSRLRIPIDNGVIEDLKELLPVDAVRLLSEHAKQSVDDDEGAYRLCNILGGHPFSIEIAGHLLHKRKTQTPNQLASEIVSAPHTLRRSIRQGDRGRANFAGLMSQSIKTLQAEAENIPEVAGSYDLFLLIGFLPKPSATLTLLQHILGQPEGQIRQALWHLDEHGLLEYDDSEPYPHYILHNLTFSYAATLSDSSDKLNAQILQGVEVFTNAFSNDFGRLEVEIENILGAVHQTDDSEVLIRVVERLMVQGYFYSRGFNQTPALLQCADRAIEAARQHAPHYNEQLHYLTGKRGDAARSQKHYDDALRYYEESLKYTPNPNREVTMMSLIAVIHYRRNELTLSNEYFDRAWQIAEDNQDQEGLIRVLEYRGSAAWDSKDYELAYPLLEQAVTLAQQFNDSRRLFWSLYNLSMLCVETERIQQAYDTLMEAQQIKALGQNILWQGFVQSGLARVYHNWNERDQAQVYLDQAVTLYREYGATEQVEWVEQFCKDKQYHFQATG